MTMVSVLLVVGVKYCLYDASTLCSSGLVQGPSEGRVSDLRRGVLRFVLRIPCIDKMNNGMMLVMKLLNLTMGNRRRSRIRTKNYVISCRCGQGSTGVCCCV